MYNYNCINNNLCDASGAAMQNMVVGGHGGISPLNEKLYRDQHKF